jgi:hypothetical protein
VRRVRKRLSYANVTATLALAIAVGTGGAWAAGQLIDGKILKNRSVAGKKLKKDTVTGKEVKEKTLAKVPKAKVADKLGGILPGGFVTGAGNHTAGRTTGAGGAEGNVIRTFQTPAGRFQFTCGTASASVVYVNNTAGDADVFETFSYGNPSGTSGTTYTLVPKDTGDVHFAATGASGPTLVEQRASKGPSIAILRVSEVRIGTNCIWNWDLFTSG